jgi:hypothetical protein
MVSVKVSAVGTMGQGYPQYPAKTQDKNWVNPRQSALDLAGQEEPALVPSLSMPRPKTDPPPKPSTLLLHPRVSHPEC